MRKRRVLWLRPLTAGVLVLALYGLFWAGNSSAQPAHADTDRQMYNYLRTVINAGADLFNLQRNFDSCHDLYKGSLTTIRPLLNHHPDLQKAIDTGLAKADQEKSVVEKAFALRSTLDTVRDGLRRSFQPDVKPPVEKKPVEKKPDVDPPIQEDARVSGKVTLNGKPVPIGYITFHGPKGRSFSTYIDRDGSYSLKTPVVPGQYRVTVESAPDPATGAPLPGAPKLPQRYENPQSSQIVTELRSGINEMDFNLQK